MEGILSRGRTSTHRRFEERHPDLWDEVQVMIESDRSPAGERSEARSIFSRLFRIGGGNRSSAGRIRLDREDS